MQNIDEIYKQYAETVYKYIFCLSGDKNLTKQVRNENENIITVSTKEGRHGAVISKHPSVTNAQIKERVQEALS